MWLKADERPMYDKALKALSEAHQACFKHEDRDTLGMSHGPFSGVNEALGIVLKLETLVAAQHLEIMQLKLALISDVLKEREDYAPPDPQPRDLPE